YDDWKWRLATLPFTFRGLGVYSAGDVLNYAFLASRLQSAGLQIKLLRYSGIVASGPTFDDALCVFNMSMKTDILSNPSEIVSPKLMKKSADIYFTRVTNTTESTFLYLLDIWIYGNVKWRITLLTGLGWFRFLPCLACSMVFAGDIYGDHVVSCVGIIGIKHHHNVMRNTLVNICYRSRILAGKEITSSGYVTLLVDGGLDVCVDLTGSSPLTQTEMDDFAL
nr:hypothetical protein [Tanacetum cinerariifolium]